MEAVGISNRGGSDRGGAVRTIIENVLAVTMNAKREIGACTIVIEGERISALRFTGAGGKPQSHMSSAAKPGAPAKDSLQPGPGDVVIDGRGKIALPGFVNGHVHCDMTLARGLGDGLTLYEQDHDSFISDKRWFKKELGREARYLGKLLQYVESVKGGTTFLCDVPFWFHGEDLARPFREVGLDGAVVIDFRKDFLTGEGVDREEYLGTARALRRSGILPIVEGPAEEDYNVPLLIELSEWAEDLDTFMQMHLAETAWRIKIVKERFGTSPVRLLREIGILDRRIMGSHGVHIDEEEIGLLAASGARIVNCPTSEMKIADGIAPVAKMLAAGVPTGLGTDGALWNDSGDIFAEMKSLMLLQRVAFGASSVSASDCLGSATAEGARVFGVDGDLGSLEPGKRASFILVDYMKPHGVPCYSGRVSNVEQALTSCLRASDVDAVFVSGRNVVKGGKIQTVDEEALVKECQELGTRIFSDMERGSDNTP